MRKIVFLCFIFIVAFLLAAVISFFVIEKYTAQLVTQSAKQSAEQWSSYFAQNLPGIEKLAQSGTVDQAQREFIEHQSVRGNIFRFKLFSPDGRVRVISDEMYEILNDPDNMFISDVDPNAVMVISSGKSYIEVNDGRNKADRPDLYAEAYTPVLKDGSFIGVVEVYVDQTGLQTIYRENSRKLVFEVVAILLSMLLIPIVIVYRQTLSIKKANRAVKESETRFKDVAEISGDWIWEMDADLRFSFLSDRLFNIFALSPKDILGKTREEFAGVNTDNEHWRQHFDDLANRRAFRDFQYTATVGDGSTRNILMNGKPVFDADGVFLGYRGTGTDRTSEAEARCALEESEKQFRQQNGRFNAALSNISSALCMFDADQRLVICNERYGTMYGLSSDCLVPGTTFREILEYRRSTGNFSGDTHKEYIEERLAAVSDQKSSRKIQRLNDGRILEIFHRPLQGGGWLATHDDVTERKKIEAELLQHRDHLQELVAQATTELQQKAAELELALAGEKELSQMQRQFVSMASHEFRTPLAIIDLAAQRMARKVDKHNPEDAIKRIDKIRNAVQRMTRLMESTLSAARMEEGKIFLKIGDYDIGKRIKSFCKAHQEIAPNHVITCELTDLPDTIQTDKSALEQVLTNLLSNAVKYSRDAPQIDVVARRDGDEVVISVRDHGIGIDAEDLPRISERFFRAKTSTGIVGTGIGLNLVKTMVTMHDGTFLIESKKGEGTTVTVRLPIEGPKVVEQSDIKAA